MSKDVTCPTCKGKGTVIRGESFLRVGKEVQCPNCKGVGKVTKHG